MTRAKQSQSRHPFRHKLFLGLGFLCALAPAAAPASTIETTSGKGPSPALLQTPWAKAMLRDSQPDVHASAITTTASEVAPASTPVGPITEGQIANQLLKLMAKNGGHLPDDLFVESLERRRNLDPSRFDLWHPHVGAILAANPPTPSLPPTTITAQQVLPPPPKNPPPVTQDNPPPIVPPTPEPASVVVALGLLASASWLRRCARAR